MFSVNDLQRFRIILENAKEPNIIRMRLLKSLDEWQPIKSHIIASQIGKCLYKLTNLHGEIGSKSKSIVNKWKTILINNNDIEKKVNVCKSQINKRENQSKIIDVHPKKKSLSLTDYYKRNPKLEPESVTEKKSQIISQNELNADSGISFLDSITIKPLIKARNNNIITKSQLIRGVTNRLAQPIDISSNLSSTIMSNDDAEVEDTYVKVQCHPKLYHTANRQVMEETEIDVKYFDKNITNPPSLLNQCQDVLFMHRECIEEVLWTPRELLLRVLTAYTADQLMNFEIFNPRYIEENDDLWKVHCIKKHPKESKDITSGSWRDRYMKLNSDLEMKMKKSVLELKTKLDNIRNETLRKKIKVLPAPRKNPSVGRFFYRQGENSNYSPATRKLRKQYKAVFNHLR